MFSQYYENKRDWDDMLGGDDMQKEGRDKWDQERERDRERESDRKWEREEERVQGSGHRGYERDQAEENWRYEMEEDDMDGGYDRLEGGSSDDDDYYYGKKGRDL